MTFRDGSVPRSIDSRKRTSSLRSCGSVRVSKPSARPTLRCVTFSSTASSVAAAPLCRYGAEAKTLTSDGGLNPRIPRAWTFAALFARISLLTPSANRFGSKVPTRHRNFTS